MSSNDPPTQWLLSANISVHQRFKNPGPLMDADGPLMQQPSSLTRGLPPHPPRPLLPQPKPWGRGGARGLQVFVGWVERALPRNPPSSMGNRQTPF
jgi:hypothetical protein